MWFQPTLKKELEEKIVPAQLSKLELMLKSNNGGDGYFVGDSVSIVALTISRQREVLQ